MSFRDILIPLDGSRFAEAALPMALRLAKSAHARLHLALAHEPAVVPVGLGEAVAQPADDSQGRLWRQSYLIETVDQLKQACAGEVDFRELEGPAGPVICEEATRLDIDLVVMATHGRGAMGRLWLGSVADYLIRHLNLPVLLVHPDRGRVPLPKNLSRSILVALDLSRDAEAILEPVITLTQLTQGHVTLLHNLEPALGTATQVPYPVPFDPVLLEENRRYAQSQLDRLADRLRLRGVSVSARISTGTSTAAVLLEELEKSEYDLIAMTTHGKRGLGRLLLGSVADKVIRGASKPVLVMRPLPTGTA